MIKRNWPFVAILFIIFFVIQGFLYYTYRNNIPKDETLLNSATEPNDRSVLFVVKDYMTGCQYLVTNYGGPTPRLDSHGKHICD